MFDLSKDTILVRIRFSKPSGSKKDKTSSRDTAERHNADSDYVSTYVMTLPEEDRLSYQTIETAARNWFKEVTVAWDDSGWRLVPIKEYERIRQELEQWKAKYLEAAHALIFRLPDILERLQSSGDKGSLGSLINNIRLPDRRQMERAFDCKIETMPIPDPNDVRLSHISPEAMRKIVEETRAEQSEKIQEAVRQAVEKIQMVVEAIARQACGEIETKDEETGKVSYRPMNFKDALIDNARSLVSVLPGLNITNDPWIKQLGDDLERDLCPIEAKEVRKNPAKRPEVAKKALSILEKLKAGAVSAKV